MTYNYWRTGSWSGYYLGVKPASLSDYEFDLTYDIYGNYPLSANVEEVVNGVHLNGHPNVEIQHWITLYGYNGSGSGTSYEDPANSSAVYFGASVPPYNYGFSSSSMYTLVTDAGPHGGPYGIVW